VKGHCEERSRDKGWLDVLISVWQVETEIQRGIVGILYKGMEWVLLSNMADRRIDEG
jgi:hypothetical protein